MNQFSQPISPTLSIGWLLFTIFFVPNLLQAQFARKFPTVDVTTDIMGWTEKSGGIAAQVSTFKWLGLRAGVAYSPRQGQTENFLTRSSSLELLGEARMFPFGSPREVYKKDTRPKFWKKPKPGCTGKTCLGEISGIGINKIFKGLFIAPGFSFSRYDEAYIPKADQNALRSVEGYETHLVKKAPVLTTGYQIRLRNFTLSAGYVLKGGLDNSPASTSGQNRNVKALNRAVFPWNINVERKWCIEAGINF